MRKEVHITPADDQEGWDIKISGNDKVVKHFSSKEKAVQHGRQLNIHIGGKLIIHDESEKSD
ncbi:MAG TPA: DUF2188 domain-containing protein [Balneolales bacterium]|nr:DUF2188 domain-containing protein [Balneolales bacterium]